MNIPKTAWLAVIIATTALTAATVPAQEAPKGWEVAALPAINYDADEGLGYGAIVELYSRGAGGLEPYRFTVQPTVFLTTGGRRDFTLFFDAPRLLPGGWRADAYLGSERQLASPYYGLGNGTAVDPGREEDEANPYYYRFGRTRRQVSGNLQHGLGGLPLRALIGAGVVHNTIDAVPNDSGTTFLAAELASEPAEPLPGGYSNFVRGGLVWDTRDREVGPTRGSWSELLVQRVDEALGRVRPGRREARRALDAVGVRLARVRALAELCVAAVRSAAGVVLARQRRRAWNGHRASRGRNPRLLGIRPGLLPRLLLRIALLR
ncbi:MAG: hypothetical protein KY464_16410, partial [Gemmatimonadetes bacterium]|nr:hypothetical protein [Gemmatimonadota bacterium]